FDAKGRTSPGILSRRGLLTEIQRRGIQQLQGRRRAGIPAAWEAAVDAWLAGFEVAAPLVAARLNQAVQILGHLQPSLRDIWRAHVLFEGNQVSGMVDLAALRLDHPATDIARLLASIAGDDTATWQAGLA